MGKKLVPITFAVLAFAFATAPRSNAGTDMIEPYRAPAQTYAPPPPRPVVYVPPVRFGVAFGPAYGFYGPRFFRGPRFVHRRAFWRGHPHRWH